MYLVTFDLKRPSFQRSASSPSDVLSNCEIQTTQHFDGRRSLDCVCDCCSSCHEVGLLRRSCQFMLILNLFKARLTSSYVNGVWGREGPFLPGTICSRTHQYISRWTATLPVDNTQSGDRIVRRHLTWKPTRPTVDVNTGKVAVSTSAPMLFIIITVILDKNLKQRKGDEAVKGM